MCTLSQIAIRCQLNCKRLIFHHDLTIFFRDERVHVLYVLPYPPLALRHFRLHPREREFQSSVYRRHSLYLFLKAEELFKFSSRPCMWHFVCRRRLYQAVTRKLADRTPRGWGRSPEGEARENCRKLWHKVNTGVSVMDFNVLCWHWDCLKIFSRSVAYT